LENLKEEGQVAETWTTV